MDDEEAKDLSQNAKIKGLFISVYNRRQKGRKNDQWWLLLLLPSVLGDLQILLNREPPGPSASSRSTDYEERWLTIRLNQFDASDTQTFDMRYYYNEISADASNIVIFVGGEWAITPGWVTGGLAHDLASTTNASLFYTEHRYYGLTRPSNDTSVEALRYLTVDQALADLSQFISYVKSEEFEGGRYRNAKVALVGCSYAGTMATWMQLQYPHLVDAAFSDSGPLYAKEDFYEYLEVVGDALRLQGGQDCFDTVQSAVTQVTQLLEQTNGLFQVSQMFNTCTTLSSQAMDIASFHWFGLIMPFAWLVQNAQPGQVAAACAALTNQTEPDHVARLAAWLRPRTQPCVETRYTVVVDANRNTSFDSPVATGRAWLYQTCIEYGWYQTTRGSRQPFGSGVPVYYFHQLCRDVFSVDQNPDRLRYGIDRTNLFFGGMHIPDRVVTTQGQFDPWRPMGPGASNSTPLTPVYIVPEASHCRIVLPIAETDSDEVRTVKIQVINDMSNWMLGRPVASAARVISSAVLLFGLLIALL